ncbi:hypothetical protein BC830DRAFT_1152416 [Chytriomyces sp. MP71]|nr:hypothetical protein BC830DRAFT_1152416 [Chytriomyces sp. MP71]
MRKMLCSSIYTILFDITVQLLCLFISDFLHIFFVYVCMHCGTVYCRWGIIRNKDHLRLHYTFSTVLADAYALLCRYNRHHPWF